MYHDPTGFSVPIPVGATIRPDGSEMYFQKDNRLLIIDQTDQPKPDPVADWTNQEADRRDRVYRNYHRIRLVPVKFWTKAADWEFTYTTPQGNPQHAQKRGVITGPKQAYGLSWYTSPSDWAASLPDLHLIYQGFQPKK
jgi:eukaryotic-like serine/threonine-protein kinase